METRSKCPDWFAQGPTAFAVIKVFVVLSSVVASISGIFSLLLLPTILVSSVWSDIIIVDLTTNVVLAVLVILDNQFGRFCLLNIWIVGQLMGLVLLGYLVWQNESHHLIGWLILAASLWLMVAVISRVYFCRRVWLVKALHRDVPLEPLQEPPQPPEQLIELPPAYDDLLMECSPSLEPSPPAYDEL